MGADHKDKKRKYEPPKVYEIETDMTQAMGQSLCANGADAAGECTGFGQHAGTLCSHGPSGELTWGCYKGNNPHR